ncbi:MAG TPA: hypothetical protein PLD59_13095 [Tepidisphaeraceae bacterium]|nr:hypothetical protein [Tepidisphaeraceae bacterium]
MSESTQHIIVYVIVVLCVLFFLHQAFGSWFGRKSVLGKCCEKGCSAGSASKVGSESFVSVESLSRKGTGA